MADSSAAAQPEGSAAGADVSAAADAEPEGTPWDSEESLEWYCELSRKTNPGDLSRTVEFLRRAQAGEELTVGFIGGSITQGERCVEAALHSEMSGVAAVVVNTSIPVESISALVEKVAVPVCVTACAADDVVHRQIAAGASIVNVAAGARTPQVVEALRREYPDLPIIATGGPTDDAIRATIAAGADAVSWTPPAIADLEREVMEKARRLAAELL